MISRLDRFIRAVHVPLVASILILMPPSSAWPQEQTPGTIAVPSAGTEQQPGPEAETIAAGASTAAAGQPGTYTVVKGDTLWDISNAHYRDPFLWPLIWKSNPFITDPDLIYPGNVLVIPSLAPIERAISAPEEAEPAREKMVEEKAPPPPPPAEAVGVPSFFRQKGVETVTGPEEAPETTSHLVIPEDTRPTILDKYGVLSGGFVSDEPSEDSIVTHAIDQGKSVLGYDDVVYVSIRSRQDVKAGDLFLIYKPLHNVKHPVNGRYYGKLNRVMGIVKIIEVNEDGPHKGRITRSFDAAEPGSLLTPYQQPEPLYTPTEKQQKDLAGYILEVTDRRTINAQVDIVYLDKGKIDGVEPGDRFTVLAEEYVDMRKAEKSRIMPEDRGEIQVFLVKERTATAIVRKSTNVISKGDRVEFKN